MRSTVVLFAALATLSACATLSFKPGAGPDRMSADEHACGQAGDEGFVECMRNLGYYMSDGAIGSPLTPTPVVAAAADASLTPTPTAAPAVVATAAPVPASPPPATHSPTVAPAPAAASATAPTDTSGGLPRVRVGSWWKLGGSAAGLDSSIAGCVQKLGTPHQPPPGAQVVTIGMRDCLRGDGWIAYNETPVP